MRGCCLSPVCLDIQENASLMRISASGALGCWQCCGCTKYDKASQLALAKEGMFVPSFNQSMSKLAFLGVFTIRWICRDCSCGSWLAQGQVG